MEKAAGNTKYFFDNAHVMHMPDVNRRESPSIATEKFLLCRPIGGLNDTLCQIEKCWRYAEKFGRTLIIDTCKSRIHGAFSEYFQPLHPSPKVLFELDSFHLYLINTLTCHPSVIEHRIDKYESIGFNKVKNFVEKNSYIQITFDFEKDYEESLLVHEQCGSGTISASLLNRIMLNPEIAREAENTIEKLGKNYVALHVRNTDYKTDYKKFFKKIYPKVSDMTVLICSDDANVVSYAMRYFDKSIVITSTTTPDLGGKPAHCRNSYVSNEQAKRAIRDAIIDLLAIGNAKDVFFANIWVGKKPLLRKIWDFLSLPAPCHYSGFSKLALYLCKNKQVMYSLLQKHPTD